MIKTKLFDGEPTAAQQIIIAFWLLNIGGVLVLWATTAEFGDLPSVLDAFGMLFGLLAVYFALTQFMLMGRVGWIERRFGLEHLASYHRINGYLAIGFILIHPIFITVSYALASHQSLTAQYFDLILHYNFVWLALVAEILFVVVVATSVYISRRRLRFETWYFVHLLVYGAIIAAPFHQFTVGDSFAGDEHPLARAYWAGLYAFVALNLLIWRFGAPLFSYWRHAWRIERVVAETPTATSVYIRGKHMGRWGSRPGQFVMIRIFAKGIWWQEHPFSLSWLPHDDMLRLTIRHVGDYTTAIAGVQPGTRVIVSGPLGRFTREVAQTNQRLFIAGGVGITPIRALVEEAGRLRQDSVLLYANRTPSNVLFAAELDRLAGKQLKIIDVYNEPPKSYRGETGYIDLPRIERLVPDYANRDIYLCGPPPMMTSLVAELTASSIRPELIHYERFALHN